MTGHPATLAAKDKRFVWHPFTQMHDWLASEPLVIERAEGNYLIDTEGNRYLDGVSSLWVTVHGHRRPEIDAAIRAQLDRVAHTTLLGLASVPSIELAERLVDIAPRGLSKVFYSDSGSTAVEVALKMAYQYWLHRGQPQKRRFLALSEAYHGDTIGAVSVGGIDLFHQVFRPLLFDALRVPTPHWYRCHDAPDPISCRDLCLAALERALEQHAHEIAAFILEPLVQGAAGILTHPHGYLAQAAELCRKHDVLLICDEVATGFGRTGTMFACAQEDVTPDLLCLAKGMTGGYLPLAATLATDEVFATFLGKHGDKRTFFHGHTYTGNPLACAAAIASLDIFTKERVLEHLPEKINVLGAKLQEHVAPLPHVGQVRQRGLMVGIELVMDRSTKEPFPYESAIGAQVCLESRKHGVILRPLGHVVVLMPPLSIEPSEIHHLVTSVQASITHVTGT
ncbi:MAG: adenosylmethionine--8-amino-7-oxononanoate transaminase [Deltaproteobacteria bacterium]|nr:adenosylmethionine--8-amino-7-oxononanoate transaminase [Deltaproteobacteria bacterium]